MSIEVNELRRRAHLVVRIITHERNVIDFVEMCGSEQAAAVVSSQNKQEQAYKKFVSASFNSLSVVLTRLPGQPIKDDEHSLLTQILQPTLLPENTRINLICSVHPGQPQLRHSLTALKFVTKIREALAKKLMKDSRSSTASNLGPITKDSTGIVIQDARQSAKQQSSALRNQKPYDYSHL